MKRVSLLAADRTRNGGEDFSFRLASLGVPALISI